MADDDSKKIRRREALKYIVGLGGLAALESCQKRGNDDAVKPLEPSAIPSVKAARDAVYYGFLDGPFWNGANNDGYGQDERDKIRKAMEGYTGTAIVEPGHVQGGNWDFTDDARGIKKGEYKVRNGMPYVSICGINKNAVDNANNIDGDIKQLFRDIDAIRDASGKKAGWLHRPAGYAAGRDGDIQKWQSEEIWMVDLRNEQAYKLMKDYMLKKARSFARGVKIDDLDSASYLELITRHPELTKPGEYFYTANPTDDTKKHFAGYTDKALQLASEVAKEVAAMPSNFVVNGATQNKFVVINGGFNPHPDQFDNPEKGEIIFNKLGELVKNYKVQLEKETVVNIQRYDASGNPTDVVPIATVDASAPGWLDERFDALSKALKAQDVDKVHFIAYEPAMLKPGYTPNDLNSATVGRYEQIVRNCAKNGVGLDVSVFQGSRSITDPKFLELNALERSLYGGARLSAEEGVASPVVNQPRVEGWVENPHAPSIRWRQQAVSQENTGRAAGF